VDVQTLSVFGLAAFAVGGLLWVFIYPILSGERKTEKRVASVARTEPVAVRTARTTQKSRRDTVESTLKDIEERNKKQKKLPLNVRIQQAGLSWSKRQFYIISGVIGAVLFVTVFSGAGLIPALALGFAGAFGLPRWLLSYLKKRREAKFLDAFPDAVDVIVRGIKAGLPLLDSIKVITSDSPEPVRSEFRAIIETQAVGMPLGEACAKLYDSMPLPEANFFGIVISIQQRAGGNLSEALGNLSKVLRDRKKMKAKIQAMSMEAKASAGIIGALPIAVMMLVYITSPLYISLLWTEPLGRLMIAASALWMFMGTMVMKKMINFDF
jgi:tight adherence protein B